MRPTDGMRGRAGTDWQRLGQAHAAAAHAGQGAQHAPVEPCPPPPLSTRSSARLQELRQSGFTEQELDASRAATAAQMEQLRRIAGQGKGGGSHG